MKPKRRHEEIDDSELIGEGAPDKLVLDIDKYRLDEEWNEQPKLRLEWGDKLADARALLAQAKHERDVVEADMAMKLRSNPKDYYIDKVTEAALKEALPVQLEVQQAHKRVHHFTSIVEHLEAKVAAIDQRRKGLEDMVRLFLAGYYASPRMEEDGRERMEDIAKRKIRRRGREDDE